MNGKIVGYRFEFVFDRLAHWKQGGKVSAESLKEAKDLVLKFLRSSQNSQIEYISDRSDEEILEEIQIFEFERSKEVYDHWTEKVDL